MAQGAPSIKGINRITVEGFKSLSRESTIELRPLTILAGTNSSGKSSIMQPILLMKQTLASSYDPGPLLLNGSHVRYTSAEQFLSRKGNGVATDAFSIQIGDEHGDCKLYYHSRKKLKPSLKIDRMEIMRKRDQCKLILRDDLSKEEIMEYFRESRGFVSKLTELGFERFEVNRTFCFLTLDVYREDEFPIFSMEPINLSEEINRLIHLPGLRGNPERTYTTTAVDELHHICRGTFQTYTASVIHHWQESDATETLKTLGEHLQTLGLTDKVKTKQINDVEVEVFVNRILRPSGAEDWVSIADVGLGVSQTLPVAVALLFAEPGQIVYIEQPEIHLHPRAQYNLAKLLAHAAARGVKVVVETHSSLLLRGIQTLVATDELDNELVALHWFTRNENGETIIHSADMDEIGAFGEWPEDFAEVELRAEMSYLDAVEHKEMGSGEEER